MTFIHFHLFPDLVSTDRQPIDWTDLNNQIAAHPNQTLATRFYVFLDQNTCHDILWPEYGGVLKNYDTIGNRSNSLNDCAFGCDAVEKILSSPLFLYHPHNAHLTVWECAGNYQTILKWTKYRTKVESKSGGYFAHNILLATMSSFFRDVNTFLDQGELTLLLIHVMYCLHL